MFLAVTDAALNEALRAEGRPSSSDRCSIVPLAKLRQRGFTRPLRSSARNASWTWSPQCEATLDWSTQLRWPLHPEVSNRNLESPRPLWGKGGGVEGFGLRWVEIPLIIVGVPPTASFNNATRGRARAHRPTRGLMSRHPRFAYCLHDYPRFMSKLDFTVYAPCY